MESNNNDFNNNLDDLLQQFYKNEKMSTFLRNLKQIVDIYNNLAPIASRFDFNNVPYNGVRSVMKIIERYVQKIAQQNKDTDRSVIASFFYGKHFDYDANIKDAENTSRHLLQLTKSVHKCVYDKDGVTTEEVMDMLTSVRPEVYKSWLKLGPFWLSPEAQHGSVVFNYLCAFGLGNMFGQLISLIDLCN